MADGGGKPGWLAALDATSLPNWDEEWQRLARLICSLPDTSDEYEIGVLALGDQLVERYITDMANAVAEFPDAILRAWRVDKIQVAAAFRLQSGANPSEPMDILRTMHEIDVEIAMECIIRLRSSVHLLSEASTNTSLEGGVRRILFLTVIEYLRRLLQSFETEYV